MMTRFVLAATAISLIGMGAGVAQVKPAVQTPLPSMPVFPGPTAPSNPPPTTQRTIDSSGNAVDTTQTYRTGPFGTYTDKTTITTYPPGNPSLGTTNPH